MPNVRESVAGAFDLAVSASGWIRTLSIYCGLLVLALVGPAVVLFLGIVRDVGSLGLAVDLVIGPRIAFDPPEPGSVAVLRLVTVAGFVGVFAVLIEGQILVTAALGAAASRRRLGLRDLLRLSRRVFWPVLGAALLVGSLGRASEIAIEAILRPQTVSAYESLYVVQIVTTALVTAPFAFWMAGIVIGGVGPMESMKRSARIAARRWRLAILVASAGAVLGLIEIFALGAGLDLVSRLAAALGLDIEGSAGSGIAVTFVTLASIVAASSLLVTIAALVAAPQVFVFIRMTGESGGLDRAGAGDMPGTATWLVSWPMIALIGVAGLFAVAGFSTLGRP
ncbi:MAG TPA: hypothetical protein VFO73_01395 [Candidatus Limnocylindrales bacterium]|nr:hypothetical protein [Candidatus Limnocylindrales bacterium]